MVVPRVTKCDWMFEDALYTTFKELDSLNKFSRRLESFRLSSWSTMRTGRLLRLCAACCFSSARAASVTSSRQEPRGRDPPHIQQGTWHLRELNIKQAVGINTTYAYCQYSTSIIERYKGRHSPIASTQQEAEVELAIA